MPSNRKQSAWISEEVLSRHLASRARTIEHLAQIGEAPVDVLSDVLAEAEFRQLLPKRLSASRQSALVEMTEQLVSARLQVKGYVPVRKVPGSIKGIDAPVPRTIYVRPAEQQLFDAVDQGSPVTLAMSHEQRRFAKSLIVRYAGDIDPKQVYICTIGSGIYRVTGTPPKADYQSLVRRAAPRRSSSFLSIVFSPSVGSQDEMQSSPASTLEDPSTNQNEELDEELSARCSDPRPEDFSQVLRVIVERRCKDSLYIFLDAHAFLASDSRTDPYVSLKNASAIQDAAIRLRRAGSNTKIVLIGMLFSPPRSIASEVNLVDLPLPSHRELTLCVRSRLEKQLSRWTAESLTEDELSVSDGLVRLVDEAAGMTLSDLKAALRPIAADDDGSLNAACEAIQRVKHAVIKQSPALEVIDVEKLRIPDLGAMELFTRWLRRRRQVFLQPDRARSYGISALPKGVLLLGIPGTGKSLAAKVTAKLWKLPLLRLDLGAIRDKWVGSSEQRIRDALSVVEATSPCILWIDEIDKGASQHDNNSTHSTDLNIRATLLTWMQEHRSPVFIVATANRYESLPPELTRAGRFDARFFFGCPDREGRKEILKIHLAARGIRSVRQEDSLYEDLISRTHGFTGAELEQLVLDSMYAAFEQKARDVTTEDLIERARSIKPIVKAVGKGLEEAWALIDQGRVEIASENFLRRSDLLMLIDPSLYSPMYCRKEGISGWERHATRAERLLMSGPSGGGSAVILDAGESEWLYIHTNIRFDARDQHDFKVLDSVAAISHNDLFEHLLVDYGVDNFIFEDQDFMSFFCAHSAFKQYKDFVRLARDPKYHSITERDFHGNKDR